jgi:hypothetical protein
VDELFGCKTQPLYMQWGTSLSPKSKYAKDRFLVIGEYQLFWIRRNKMGKKKVVADLIITK